MLLRLHHAEFVCARFYALDFNEVAEHNHVSTAGCGWASKAQELLCGKLNIKVENLMVIQPPFLMM
jgi:hypothetical protein